jgi:hypothetical protein
MSGINGDKSRFHRKRKQKIEQRRRTRELVKGLAEQRTSPPALSGPTSKAKVA